MSIGHGQPGLRDYLRTFSDLVDDSQASRRPFLEYTPGKEVATWALFSGATWGAYEAVQYQFDGLVRDIVGVDTSAGPLTRVRRLADCVSQAGTFYALPGSTVAANLRSWDDGVDWWDAGGSASWDATACAATRSWDDAVAWWDAAGVTWDDVSAAAGYALDLYVHLPAGEDPNDETVVALLGFYFATRGDVHPTLGGNLFTNGGFEDLSGIIESLSGSGFSSGQDTVLYVGRGSTTSLKLVSTGAATGNATRYRDISTIAGQMHRAAAYYRTDADFSGNLAARLLIGDVAGATFLDSGGRDVSASGEVVLRPTAGEWRRLMFDFLAPTTATRVQLQLRAASSAGAGQLNFDGLTVQPIDRWVYYDPRLGIGSLPEVEVASQSVFFGGKTVGLGNVSLINQDGALDASFASLLLANKPMRVHVGGALSDGQEVYRDDWRGAWPGVSRKPKWSDAAWSFDMDDERALFALRKLPERVYTLDEFPNIEKGMVGKPRPLLLGAMPFDGYIRPTRIDDTANGYGVYEVADNAEWPYVNGLATAFFRTADEAERSGRGDGGAIVNTPGDVTADATLARFTVLTDCRAMEQGDMFGSLAPEDILPLDFAVGAGDLVATVFFQGKPADVASSLAGTMTTAAGATIDVAYSETTHLVTISKPAGALSLRTNTGTNRQNKAWERLGFKTGTADRTGALSYTADSPIFVDADADHHIRVKMSALHDDAVGTISGTPLGSLTMQTDLVKLLFFAYLGFPLSKIDGASFLAARAAEPWVVGTASPLAGVNASLYLDSPTPVAEILARIERAMLADIVIDGDGIVYLISSLAASSAVVDFYDRDYITFEMDLDEATVHGAVRVLYDYDPHRGEHRKVEVANPDAPTLHGRNDPIDFETSLFDYDESDFPGGAAFSGNAPLLARRLAALAETPLRRATFSARGKLADRLVGNRIRLTRSRAPDPSGVLAAVEFRILSLRHDYLSGVSRCTAVEHIDLTAVT